MQCAIPDAQSEAVRGVDIKREEGAANFFSWLLDQGSFPFAEGKERKTKFNKAKSATKPRRIKELL